MKPVVTRAQTRAFDLAAIETCKVPGLVLMENAGRGVVDAIERHWPSRDLRRCFVVVIAGTGNNGGDGFVVARHLLTRGARVAVYLTASADRLTGDARVQHDALVGVGVTPEPIGRDLAAFKGTLAGATFVVDAIFGTGLSRPVGGTEASAIEAIDQATRPVVAIDLPSGLDADTGAVLGVAVRATLTVTFGQHKLGLLTPRGAQLSGTLVVADLGVPTSLPERSDHAAWLLESRDVARLLVPRAVDTYKNAAGHVVIFAGSSGHVGAAVMCAHGAMRAGAGLVTIATWPTAADQLDTRVTEVMTARLSPEDLVTSIDHALARAKVVVLGPGFGTDEASRAVVRHVLSAWEGPSVVDADGLSMFPDDAEVFAASKGAAVLTPHPGELARLLGSSAGEVEGDRFTALASCVERARSVTVLKGAHTLIGAPDERTVINASGTSALATAGAGDVLAGTIAALACHLDPFEAAFAGVHLHGLAAEAWTRDHGDRGLLAHEIADRYPRVLAALSASHADCPA